MNLDAARYSHAVSNMPMTVIAASVTSGLSHGYFVTFYYVTHLVLHQTKTQCFIRLLLLVLLLSDSWINHINFQKIFMTEPITMQ